MAADVNWPRWIVASVGDYFKTVADAVTPALPILIEGADEREEAKLRAKDHVELRINGPALKQLSPNEWRLYVDVNLLYTEHMGMTESAHTLYQNVGVLAEAATKPISVKRHGTGAPNDGVEIGCLTLRRKEEGVLIHHFGQIGKNERVRQSMIDASYDIYLP